MFLSSGVNFSYTPLFLDKYITYFAIPLTYKTWKLHKSLLWTMETTFKSQVISKAFTVSGRKIVFSELGPCHYSQWNIHHFVHNCEEILQEVTLWLHDNFPKKPEAKQSVNVTVLPQGPLLNKQWSICISVVQ